LISPVGRSVKTIVRRVGSATVGVVVISSVDFIWVASSVSFRRCSVITRVVIVIIIVITIIITTVIWIVVIRVIVVIVIVIRVVSPVVIIPVRIVIIIVIIAPWTYSP